MIHSQHFRPLSASLLILVSSLAASAAAADHRVEPADQPPPTDAISAAIAETLQPKCLKVVRGTSRTVCEIWLCKQWPVKQHEPAGTLAYPFSSGQLVGVIRYPRKGADFRDQDIDSGVYTMRFVAQPVDGNHVGTSVTQDFLALLPAEKDQEVSAVEYEKMVQHSAEVAGSSHPAILSLKPVEGEAEIRHDEDSDWWIVRLVGETKAGDTKKRACDLVIVGAAAE